MGLKITTPIGTDKGITDEAYVRISSYNLQRGGSATFQIEVLQNESIAKEANVMQIPNLAKNAQIGDMIFVSLTSEIVDEEGNKSFVTDLSSAIGVDIFAFGYAHLKTKLVDLFGEENVIDC